MTKQKQLHKKYLLYAFFIGYFLLNTIFLTRFPFIHSDESWLSGLSRNMLENKSFSVTESFYDLKIRNPHAIKILFHMIQVLFIQCFGYSLFNMRMISLLFGLLSLGSMYKLSAYIFNSSKWAVLAMLLLSVDIQFIYASHFARQEILLVCVLTYGLYFMFSRMDEKGYKKDLLLGVLVGLSIGLHPNSFVIALPFGLIYLYHICLTKRTHLMNLLLYAFTVAGFATGFVLLSISFDPNFISNYMAYGQSEFEVLQPISSKILQVKYYYLKLFYQVSGTYYTPNIKLQAILFLSALFFSTIILFRRKGREKENILSTLLGILAVNSGNILIGRYNQTSVIFLFPLFYILVIYAVKNLPMLYKRLSIGIIISLILIATTMQIFPLGNPTYDQYVAEISKVVPSDSVVLANLNTEYYFENGKLYDYRNLAFLKNHEMDFEEYIYKNQIQYIIYPEEMDFIYDTRPVWYGLYGNLVYYEEMKAFLTQKCDKVYEFTDSVYGIRIVRYMNTKDWKIKIYKVRDN
ncbi:ArnT family glycosyltransferase [Geosporobacter ferrireducens]|uniref:ArnT family glycosyltransferase n=1 Tax=Geosporobacter ferrireducens TaxID=1424294 RepID=UPI00139AE347|nr:glycosyltransferase family 39 protein [Geosporobacter ferrireducens]MTI56523.1 4-amino-4-deoxy-L-arabinose transferase [Geosporobacter ferrireducens]